MMNKNFQRNKPVFYVVLQTNDDPLTFEVVKRCHWECDAIRHRREMEKEIGGPLFVISSKEWID